MFYSIAKHDLGLKEFFPLIRFNMRRYIKKGKFSTSELRVGGCKLPTEDCHNPLQKSSVLQDLRKFWLGSGIINQHAKDFLILLLQGS